MKQRRNNDVEAMHTQKMRDLASQPNTTVYEATHDVVREPWKVSRLRPILERLVERVLSFPDNVSDFCLRKTCLDDAEIACFQKAHPEMYYLLTNRDVMREEKSRKAITGLLYLREQIEAGVITDGKEADAMATKSVVAALGMDHQEKK